jgi:hypothetical protein
MGTECVAAFDLDPIVGSMFQCLTLGSQFLTNYTLKVIARITGEPNPLGMVFADETFLEVFVSLRNECRTPMQLKYVMSFDTTSKPKERNLKLGFHALSVLNNIGNPEVFRHCLELGILDFNVEECATDQELLAVFVRLFKRMIQSGQDIAECCVNSPIFPLLLNVCAGASVRARIGMVRVIAFLITGLGVSFLQPLMQFNPDFLEELVEGFEQGTEGLKLKIARSFMVIVNELPDTRNYLAARHEAIFGDDPETRELGECLDALYPLLQPGEGE